jgi:hypothetical protein
MRSGAGSGGGGDAGGSVTDQLINELEEKKNEANELRARLKEAEASSRERLSKMADALDEKDKIIAELQKRPSESSVVRTAPEDNGEAERIIKELEERLNEKERLLAEACRERDRNAVAAEEMRAGGSGDGEGGAIATALVRAEGDAAIAEKAQLEADLDQLRGEMDAILRRDLESRAKYEERIAELDKQVIALQQQCEESRGERPEAVVAEGPDPLAIHVGGFSPDVTSANERIRTLELDLDEKDLSYRTVQAQLHRLRVTQHLMRGLCAGLSVFLVFLISIKTRQPQAPRMEAAQILPPVSITESAAEVNDETLSPAEIPSRHAVESERNETKTKTIEEIVMPEPVTQVAASETAGGAEDRIAYTIQKGDNLWLICKRMLGEGEATSRIARENNIVDPRALKVGDVIYLSRR